jgi:serine phosphatase RsbU (regulator of sigma subunit)
VIECRNAKDETFSIERLEAFFRHGGPQPVATLVQRLIERKAEFRQGRTASDDTAVLIAEVTE